MVFNWVLKKQNQWSFWLIRNDKENTVNQSRHKVIMWTFIPAKFFSVKCVTFFVSTKPEFLKISRRLLKIVEDIRRSPKVSDNFQRLPKIKKDFWRLQSNCFSPKKINSYLIGLSNYTTVLLLSVRREKLVWMREITISDPQARQTHV